MHIVVIIAAIACLLWWNARRLFGFQKDYKYDGDFAGKRYECRLGGLSESPGMLCFMGADANGLYLFPHAKPPRSFWSFLGNRSGYEVFRKSLFIPWTDLGYRSGRAVFKECVWFDLPARKIYLYVAKDVGEKLLSDAGREMPL